MLGCEFCIYRFPCLLNIVGRTKLSFLLTPGIIRSRFKNLVSPRFIEKIVIRGNKSQAALPVAQRSRPRLSFPRLKLAVAR